MSDISTLADLPFYLLGRYQRPLLVRRSVGERFRAYATRELFDAIRDLSLGLTALGVRPGDRVAVASDSRPEWSIADLAILTTGAVTVPIYPTLAVPQVKYILRDAGVRLALVADETQAGKVREVWPELPALERLVIVDTESSSSEDGTVLSFAEVTRRGHERRVSET